ncbi:MAG: futalosine hydrolase [Bacteroidia bacterium]|nr:futalosine hydrolase [Bacteroidia bacterium]
MYKVLIVTATPFELNEIIETVSLKTGDVKRIITESNFLVDVLISGIGMVATTFNLTQCLNKNSYDIVLQAGVGGSFDHNLTLGQVVNITTDCFIEMGTFSDKFESIFDLGLVDKNALPYFNGLVHASVGDNFLKTLPQVKAITVNHISGNLQHIDNLNNYFKKLNYFPTIESMEGAALFYVCNCFNIKCYQIRSVSNYIEPRNKHNWQLQKSIKALQKIVIEWLQLNKLITHQRL